MANRLIELLAAYQARDPAARSKLEIFLLYPGVHAIIRHRIAHFFYQRKLFFLARLESQWNLARSSLKESTKAITIAIEIVWLLANARDCNEREKEFASNG